MIGSGKSIFQIAQHRIHPFEGGMLGGLFAASGNYGSMDAARIPEGCETDQAIGNNLAPGINMLAAPALQRLFAESGNTIQLDFHGMSVFHFNGCHKGRFPLTASASLAARLLAAKVRVVYQNIAADPLAVSVLSL